MLGVPCVSDFACAEGQVMNVDLSEKELGIITESLLAQVHAYQTEGFDDKVEESRGELEWLITKLQAADRTRR